MKTKQVHAPKTAFKPDFSIYIAQDHTPAVFDPAKTAMLKSYRLDRAQGHGWEFEVVDPRNLGKHGHAF